MKIRGSNIILICTLFNLIFLIACNKEKETAEPINVHVAFEKLDEEYSKPDNLFNKNGIEIISIAVDEENNTLNVGMLVVNRKTKNKFREIFFDQILNGEVKLNISQEERAIPH